MEPFRLLPQLSKTSKWIHFHFMHMVPLVLLLTWFLRCSSLWLFTVIDPPGTLIRITVKGNVSPLVAPINYSSSNPLIIGVSTSSPQILSQKLPKLTISSNSKPVTELVLIIREIGTNRFHKSVGVQARSSILAKEISRGKWKKRKGEGIAIDKPKKRRGSLMKRQYIS